MDDGAPEGFLARASLDAKNPSFHAYRWRAAHLSTRRDFF